MGHGVPLGKPEWLGDSNRYRPQITQLPLALLRLVVWRNQEIHDDASR